MLKKITKFKKIKYNLKLQNKPPKNLQELQESLLQLQEQWLEGFWAFDRENKPGNRGSITASSPLPFPADGDTHRHLQKAKT
jgi:hypothetical protein